MSDELHRLQDLWDVTVGNKAWDSGCECVCEEHPGKPWPHDNCAGPGMPPLRLETYRQRIASLEHELRRIQAVVGEEDYDLIETLLEGK